MFYWYFLNLKIPVQLSLQEEEAEAKLNTNILHYRNYAWRAAECNEMDRLAEVSSEHAKRN